MHKLYQNRGVCSSGVEFDLEEGVVSHVQFHGGCNGNLQGIARLIDGVPAEYVIERLRGIKCGFKSTSCPDQLAMALEKAMEEEHEA